jgi:hypothetical protein
MDTFILLPNEVVLKNGQAIVGPSTLNVHLSNFRLVIQNNANNIVFTELLSKLDHVNLIHSTWLNPGVLKIAFKDGKFADMTIIEGGVENKSAMTDWFNYIDQTIINNNLLSQK